MSQDALKPRLMVAIDTKTRDDFFRQLDQFEGLSLVVKVGLRMLPQLSLKELAEIRARGFELFIDAKLHDIPSQVAETVEVFGSIGAEFLTVHLSGGFEMLSLAQIAAAKSKTRLLGVSVLTSLSDEDLEDVGIATGAAVQVEKLVLLGLRAGLSGFVCSAQDLQSLVRNEQLRARWPLFVTPGISTGLGQVGADQTRVATVETACSLGSGALVVGRGISAAESPRKAAEEVLSRIDRFWQEATQS